jgi:hypothetical protein
VNPNEVVVHVEDCQRGYVILDFLRERVREPRKTPHTHPHGEVLCTLASLGFGNISIEKTGRCRCLLLLVPSRLSATGRDL